MTELTIKIKAKEWENTIGIKETISIALEEIHGVTDVEVINVEVKRDE